jgi:hypothetical protein
VERDAAEPGRASSRGPPSTTAVGGGYSTEVCPHRPDETHVDPSRAADTAYQGSGPTVAVPHRRWRLDPDTGRMRPLSQAQKDVNLAHARRRGPGERVNAELKNWTILRKIRSSPNQAGQLIAAVQTLIIANT